MTSTRPVASVILADGTGNEAPKRVGRPLPAGDFTTWDLAEEVSAGPLSQLEVSPVATCPSEYKLMAGAQVAANSSYLCYALKQGQVRVNHVPTQNRSLLRGHTAPAADMKFFSDKSNKLATCGVDGIFIWELTLDTASNSIKDEVLLKFEVTGCQMTRIWWHPTNDAVVAALTDTGNVFVLHFPPAAPGEERKGSAVVVPDSPGSAYPGQKAMSCAFAPNANYLAVGYGSGAVDLWSFEVADGAVTLGSTPAKTFIPDPDGDMVHGAAVGELLWPVQTPGVLISAAHGARRSITIGAVDCGALSYSQKQTLTLAVEEHDGGDEFHCHLALSPDGRTLVVGNTLRSEVYVIRADPASFRFKWGAAFSVGAPMLSVAAVFPASAGGGAEDEEDVRLYCQQSNAVAQCRIDLSICEPESEAAPEGAGSEEKEEAAERAQAPAAAAAPPAPEPAPVTPPSPSPPPPSSLPTVLGSVGSGRFPPPPDTPVQPRTPPPTPAGGVGESDPINLPIAGLRLLSSSSSSMRDTGSPGPASEGSTTPHAPPKPHVSFSGVHETVPPPPKPHVSFSDELRTGGEQRAPNPPRPHVSFSDEKPAERVPHPPKPHVSFSDGTAPGQPVPEPAAASSSRLSSGGLPGPIILEGPVTKRLSGSGGDSSAVLGELQMMESRLLSALTSKLDSISKQQEQAAQRREQQAADRIASALAKQMPKLLDAAAKAQADAVAATAVARLGPALEKAVADAVKNAVDKMPGQLEKGVSAKIAADIQRTMPKALGEAVRGALQTSLVPAFEASCQSVFGQVAGTFDRGVAEMAAEMRGHAAPLQQAIGSAQSLAAALDSTASRLAAAASERSPMAQQTPIRGARSLEAVEAKQMDPTEQVRQLLIERRFADAFSTALNCGDVNVVAWLCEKVTPSQVVTSSPPLLSQPVLLSLLQQLGFDLLQKPQLKLGWIRDSAMALNPADPSIAPHVRPVLSELYGKLQGLTHVADPLVVSDLRLCMHVVNSLLVSCP